MKLDFAPCHNIPKPPSGVAWPEERFRHIPEVVDFDALPDSTKSTVQPIGPTSVVMGEKIEVKVTLYDRQGRPRQTGGDLVRLFNSQWIVPYILFNLIIII